MLTGIVGAPPSVMLVDFIAQRSDGNAFFAEELVAAASREGQGRVRRPETLRDVLLVRLSAASAIAGRLVEIAAVAGRQVEHDVLADVCALTEVEMRTALHELVDAQCPRSTSTNWRSDTSSATRWSRKPCTTSCCRPSGAASTPHTPAPSPPASGAGAAEASRLVELAHHWTAANDPARALAAAIAAGDASRAVYAYAEAARQYEHAIELWDLVPVADRATGRDLADMFDAASAAATLMGDATQAVDLARKAIDAVDGAAGSDGDRERRAKARERFRPRRPGWRATPRPRSACSRKLSRTARGKLAVDRLCPRTRGPGGQPHAGGTFRRIRPVRGTGDHERPADRRSGNRVARDERSRR